MQAKSNGTPRRTAQWAVGSQYLATQVDKIPVFIRTRMAVEWILSTVHTFRRENFLLV